MNKFLRQAMRERGWTIPQLAQASDVSVGLAQRWVSDNPRYHVTPSPSSCEKIARALELDPDYVLEVAGHRTPHPRSQGSPMVQTELEARLARLGTTLSRYPRAVWLAVLEANDRMAEALAMSTEPPVSASEKGPVNAPSSEQTGDKSSDRGGFTLRKRPAFAALV